jgi:hypothetical protein
MQTCEVELTESGQRTVEWFEKEVYAAGAVNGMAGMQAGEWATDIFDVGAELVFCEMCNVFPNLDISTRGSVCVVNNETVNVKATTNPTGDLLALPCELGRAADWYALMVVDWPHFRCAGLARATDLFRKERLTDFGSGPVYALGQHELRFDQTPVQGRRVNGRGRERSLYVIAEDATTALHSHLRSAAEDQAGR